MVIKVFVDGQTIYAATDGGLGISTDNAATWVNIDWGKPVVVRDVYADGKTIYAATDDGVYGSEDGGTSWTHYTRQELGSERALSVWVPPAELFYAGTTDYLDVCTPGTSSRCENAGFISQQTEDIVPVNDVVGVGPEIWVATEGAGLWKTPDWSKGPWGRYGADVMDFVFSLFAQGDTIYAGHAGLSISLDDGATWTTYDTEEGLADGAVWGIYLDGASRYVYAAISDSLPGLADDPNSDSGGLSFAYCDFCQS